MTWTATPKATGRSASDVDPEIFFNLAVRIGDAVAAALEAEPLSGGASPKLRRAYPVWGEIALDDCACGQLAISLGRRADYVQFPVEISSTALRSNAQQSGCAVSPMQDYNLHLARCQPTLGTRGESPSVADLAEAARIAAVDTEVVRCTLKAELAAMEAEGLIGASIVNASQPYGPEGACGGYSTPFIIGL